MKRSLLIGILFLLPLSAGAIYQGTWTIDGSGNITAISTLPDDGTAGDHYFLATTSNISAPDSSTNIGLCSGGGAGFGPIHSSDYLTRNVFSLGGLNTGDCTAPGLYYLFFGHNYLSSGPETDFYQLYWNGATATPINPAIDDARTHFTVIAPLNGDIVPTSTPFTLTGDGVVNTTDIPSDVLTHDLSVLFSYQRITNTCIDVICAVNSSGVFNFRVPLGLVSTTTQTFTTGTTSPGVNGEGVWRLTATLQRPTSILGFSSFFGLFNFGYSTIVSTSTQWTLGTSTALDATLSGLASQTFTATTTQIALNSCLPIPGTWDMNNCVVALFVPQTAPNFSSTFGAIANKPPFGYFNQITTLINSATTTSASTTPVGMAVVATILAPLRLGLSLILWFLLLFWIFHRVRKFNFQT